VVIDDRAAALTGEWMDSGILTGIGQGYRHDGGGGGGTHSATFAADLEQGDYWVDLAYSAHPNRATNIKVTIEAGGTKTSHLLNQREEPDTDGLFKRLGKIAAAGAVSVSLSNEAADGHVIIDAVRFLPVE
jgi:hypothetical protein